MLRRGSPASGVLPDDLGFLVQTVTKTARRAGAQGGEASPAGRGTRGRLSGLRPWAATLPLVIAAPLIDGAAAAELPDGKAAPAQYVRVCTAEGIGFFYVPGTDTCLRVGGRARFEYGMIGTANRSAANGDVSEYRGLLRFNADARTPTEYGTLRSFVRLEVAQRTGSTPETSGTLQRFGVAFPGLGADTYNRAQGYVQVDKAFIQFAGLTAGRASSFFDFYAHDLELSRGTVGSDVSSTNLLAYTLKVAPGLSATLALEDPLFRRQPVFASGTATAAAPTAFGVFNPYGTATSVAPIVVARNAAGVPTVIALEDVTQKSRMPDFVGVGRYDASWGSAQLSAAVHEINGGNTLFLAGVNGGTAPAAAAAPRSSSAYGYAVQAGAKINLPFIEAGDLFYLQGAYGRGAGSYTGIQQFRAGELVSSVIFNGSPIQRYLVDAVVNPETGRFDLSESFTLVGSLLHYWTPNWRSAIFASYGEIRFGQANRSQLSEIGFGFSPTYNPNGTINASNLAAFNYSNTLRDTSLIVTGASLIWSPIADLDIGVEGQYVRAALLKGTTNDANKNPAGISVNGVPVRLSGAADTAQVRLRIQRDF